MCNDYFAESSSFDSLTGAPRSEVPFIEFDLQCMIIINMTAVTMIPPRVPPTTPPINVSYEIPVL